MRLSKTILGIAIILSYIGSFATSVKAESVNSTNTAQGMEISPALVELNAAKGNTYNITLNIRNVTASDLVYSLSADDFTAAGESGIPKVALNSNLPVTASIKTWVTMIPKFTLQSQKSKTIVAQIVVPSNAEPGGHYGVLRFSGQTPELEGTGVSIQASAGVLLLIRVDGDITEKADLSSFYSANADDKQSWFFENGPIKFVTRIQNEGNIHIKPVGSIEVRDMFGGLVSTIPANEEKSNVLPDSIRRFEGSYNKDWMFGRYTANLTLGYGSTGQAITNTITFWVIPYKLIFAGLFVLATIAFIFVRLIKVYNKYIITKSKNETKTKQQKDSDNKS